MPVVLASVRRREVQVVVELVLLLRLLQLLRRSSLDFEEVVVRLKRRML